MSDAVALQPGNRLDDADMRDAKTPGDIGRARFALGLQQVRNQLHIVLAQSICARQPSLAEAARLDALGWQGR
jgi:hypothetical protein